MNGEEYKNNRSSTPNELFRECVCRFMSLMKKIDIAEAETNEQEIGALEETIIRREIDWKSKMKID